MHSFGHAFAHPLRLTLGVTALVCAAGVLRGVSIDEPPTVDELPPSALESPLQLPRPPAQPAQPARSPLPPAVEPIAAAPAPAPVPPSAPSSTTTAVGLSAPALPPRPRRDAANPAQPAPTRLQARAARADDVIVAYQRVGRELMRLQKQRGLATTMELREEFRAINLDALTTTEARAEAALRLDELRTRIDRLWGIELSQQCIDSPLGVGCVTE